MVLWCSMPNKDFGGKSFYHRKKNKFQNKLRKLTSFGLFWIMLFCPARRRGTYFAEKSSYSHNYAFTPTAAAVATLFTTATAAAAAAATPTSERPKLASDEREMFLVTLNVGESIQLQQSDQTLCAPPVKNKATGERYNTVTATTKGSRVWIVYENGRAYPSYLVRYYCGYRDWTRTPLKTKPKPVFEWQYHDDENFTYVPYSTEHQIILEKAWKAKKSRVLIFTPYNRYEINFTTMTQTNVSHPNRKVRIIRRYDVPKESIISETTAFWTGVAAVGLMLAFTLSRRGGKRWNRIWKIHTQKIAGGETIITSPRGAIQKAFWLRLPLHPCSLVRLRRPNNIGLDTWS